MLNLEEFIQQALDSRELKRGIAVKLHLQGSTYKESADIVQKTDSFVKKWCIAYHKKGAEALRLGYKGSQGYLEASERKEIITWIQERNYWDIEELREHVELTYQVNYKDEESYYDLLKAAGLSWKKSQKRNPKKDPEQVSLKKLEITNQIAAWQSEIDSGQRSVFMRIAGHLVWGDTCGYVWGKTKERIEVAMTNERERQTYYGALDYSSKEFIVKGYATANSENTVDFLKYLQSLRPGQKISVIWDGASYHKYKAMPEYLLSINAGEPPEEWQVTCMLFAPNAPEQNPVEDIWLFAKRFIRSCYYLFNSFDMVKSLFVEILYGAFFSFPKLFAYG